jgi:hypothetical protein
MNISFVPLISSRVVSISSLWFCHVLQETLLLTFFTSSSKQLQSISPIL